MSKFRPGKRALCSVLCVCVRGSVERHIGKRLSVSSKRTEVCFIGGHLMGVEPNPILVHPDEGGCARGQLPLSVRQTRAVPVFPHLLSARGFARG